MTREQSESDQWLNSQLSKGGLCTYSPAVSIPDHPDRAFGTASPPFQGRQYASFHSTALLCARSSYREMPRLAKGGRPCRRHGRGGQECWSKVARTFCAKPQRGLSFRSLFLR